ncbi:MAG: MFS transporter [Alphaproteobacteria bacterium]|nr:MFS transporter [Alphaproteobacteria bacterium]
MPLISRSPLFYGWRVVAVCFVAAVFTWGFGVFGASVYLSEVTRLRGWSVSLVSGAVTAFYLTNALSLTAIGSFVDRFGARPVFVGGALALGFGVASIGQVVAPWQLYATFVLMGFGYASLSLTGLTATIAPWFERYQGRSVAMALTGASFGAMIVVPLMVLAIGRFGFALTVLGGGGLTIAVLVPLALAVLRYRGPQELGLQPDGDIAMPSSHGAAENPPALPWTRATAMATVPFWTAAVGFALGLTVQVGFLTHHVKLAAPILGTVGAGWLVSATGLTGVLGRLWLARVADRVNLRRYTAGILTLQATVLALIALFPTAPVLIGASLVYGFCLGQITTLSPIVVRREFGAASFGAIYSVAATVIALSSAFGPGLYGVLHDLFGGYGPVLGIAAAVELAAMATVLAGHAPDAIPARQTPERSRSGRFASEGGGRQGKGP